MWASTYTTNKALLRTTSPVNLPNRARREVLPRYLARERMPAMVHPCRGPPSEQFSSCHDSGCCRAHLFSCFHRPDREIAQCLPSSHQTLDGKCVDTAEWLCPDTWRTPPPPSSPPLRPSSPPPALPPRQPGTDIWHRCRADPSPHFAACMASGCCQDHNHFGCKAPRRLERSAPRLSLPAQRSCPQPLNHARPVRRVASRRLQEARQDVCTMFAKHWRGVPRHG